MTVEELHGELIGIYGVINNATLWLCILSALLCILTLIEFVRLCIVIKRSVKGRMDHVPAD